MDQITGTLYASPDWQVTVELNRADGVWEIRETGKVKSTRVNLGEALSAATEFILGHPLH